MPDNNRTRFRLDLIQEIISVDESNRVLQVALRPDPRRYVRVERDGKSYLHDKLDNIYFPETEFLQDIAKKLEGMPLHFQQQTIGSAAQYVRSRRPEMAARLHGAPPNDTFIDKSEAFLDSLAEDKLGFVILSVDIVGSTKLSMIMEPRKYATLISVVLHEFAEVIPRFHGHVLKYTGDGLIAYFPEPSFIIKNDLAVDCALTLQRLVGDGLNAVFSERGLPNIQIRIGLDSGEAYVETIGSPATKQHKDIIGDVVNLAAKIQAQAEPGQIYLGAATERNLHTTWRGICEPVDLSREWTYRDREGEVYRIHRVVPASGTSEC